MLAEVIAEHFPVVWITSFHLVNALAFVSFARATFVVWYPKAPMPLAAFFVIGVIIDGILRHMVPILPASMVPSLHLTTDMASAAQSCIDACSTVFLITFVIALAIDTTTNLALAALCVTLLSVVTDMFGPEDVLKVIGCSLDMTCISVPLEYNRRHSSAFSDDVTLCMVKTGSNALLATVCGVGREALLKAYAADAALDSELEATGKAPQLGVALSEKATADGGAGEANGGTTSQPVDDTHKKNL